MSLSPFKPGHSKHSLSSSAPSKEAALTRAQALLITAGIAGLIGLSGGAVVRFLLSNSANARFLSPLQTFPAIPTWASDLSADELAGSELSDEDSLSRFGAVEDATVPLESADSSLNATPDTAEESFNPSTFDAFAARSGSGKRSEDPLETLKRGPKIGEAAVPGLSGSNSFEAEAKSDSNAAGSAVTEEADPGYAAEDYATDGGYAEEGYAEEGYAEEGYAVDDVYAADDVYADDGYLDNYPAIEEPSADDGAYYTDDGQY
jgi:hypothetical protein